MSHCYCWLQEVVLDRDFFLSKPFSFDKPFALRRVLLPFVLVASKSFAALDLGLLGSVSAWTRLSLSASSSSSSPNSMGAMAAVSRAKSWSVWDLWVRRFIGCLARVFCCSGAAVVIEALGVLLIAVAADDAVMAKELFNGSTMKLCLPVDADDTVLLYTLGGDDRRCSNIEFLRPVLIFSMARELLSRENLLMSSSMNTLSSSGYAIIGATNFDARPIQE